MHEAEKVASLNNKKSGNVYSISLGINVFKLCSLHLFILNWPTQPPLQ
jgi:hypothetical protein